MRGIFNPNLIGIKIVEWTIVMRGMIKSNDVQWWFLIMLQNLEKQTEEKKILNIR